MGAPGAILLDTKISPIAQVAPEAGPHRDSTGNVENEGGCTNSRHSPIFWTEKRNK
jgi:hypothetical protein